MKISTANKEQAISYLKENAGMFASKITPVYNLLKWKWGCGEDSFIPCRYQIENTILSLISGLERYYENKDEDNMDCATGGIVVSIKKTSLGNIEASLKMEIQDTVYYPPTKES